MGCYGDEFATTPHVDALAAKGLTYRMAWSNAPVCAPARTTIISGLYPPSTGSEHMRSLLPYPNGQHMYPDLLQAAGYYTSNNSKEDYNLAAPASGKGWSDSSPQAHWRNRTAGQPFFAVFNATRSHESGIRRRPHTPIHDPAAVKVPSYHPDTPEVRRDWAQYYDVVSQADAIAGEHLQALAEAGLTEDTLVFYYGDHGSGMPRSKRWPGNSGQQVPMVVYVPEKFQALRPEDYVPGGMSDRLVGFIDLAPTVLSLAGVKPPASMQGTAFLGKYIGPAADYLYGFRGRMDERNDLVRSITDGRYVYLRNYLPYLPAGQYIDYQMKTPTTAVWRAMFDADELNATQAAFWLPRAPEELYDLRNDPDEVNNLADSPAHQAIKARLRAAQQAHAREILDVGFLPEGELFTRAPGESPYDFARQPGVYPFARVFAMAELASLPAPESLSALRAGLHDEDSAVRYWAALGLRMQEAAGLPALRMALDDPSPFVRIVAADALVNFGHGEDRERGMALLLAHGDPRRHDGFVSAAALAVIDGLSAVPAPVKSAIADYAFESGQWPDGRYRNVLEGVLDHLHGVVGK